MFVVWETPGETAATLVVVGDGGFRFGKIRVKLHRP
jgi:hypothetical protein